MTTQKLINYAWLSVVAAMLTIVLKVSAWWLTESVGLMSDALESGINLAGALMALSMLTLAAMPADENHSFGHGKAEYFSSGFEGCLIIGAAFYIAYTAVERLFSPQPLEQIGIGTILAIVASLINLFTGMVLLKAARQHRSITLEADARHLFSDVWTTAAVLVGIIAAWSTNWWWLDPLLAMLVAVNIIWTGLRLLQRSIAGLMDESVPPEEQKIITSVLDRWCHDDINYHALRTRQAGTRSFATVHVLMPGEWTIQQGHDLSEQIELELLAVLPHLRMTIHLEPLNDPSSMEDAGLDRVAAH